MQLFSADSMFDGFAQRAIFRTYYGGADFGECLSTMQRINNGTSSDWYTEWMNTGDRVADIGAACLKKNHVASAREAYFRATTYYHAAYFPLFGNPVDSRLITAFANETECFQQAAALCMPEIEVIEIPFEQSSLPAYFIKVDDSGKPRPTMVHTNGYDSNIQEMYFNHALAATRRGYNCLLFDGPGQGRNLVRDNIVMRPDWENVVSQVIDYALSRPDVDPRKIVLAGWSFGGFLAPRAAAFEHRIAALIADPGQWDMRDTFLAPLPLSSEDKANFPNIDPDKLKPIEDAIRNKGEKDLMYWKIIQRGYWVHGVNNFYDYLKEMLKYNISSVADRIACPTLLTSAEGDPLSNNVPFLYESLKMPNKKLISFSLAEGGGGHCEAMARSLYHQRVFDWLDETLSK